MGPAEADTLDGVYRTERHHSGTYFHVAFGACDGDENRSCGTIVAAYTADHEPIQDHEHLGAPIIWDAEHSGRGHHLGGRLWGPETNLTYVLKILVKGRRMHVSTCAGPVCRTQVWDRVSEDG